MDAGWVVIPLIRSQVKNNQHPTGAGSRPARRNPFNQVTSKKSSGGGGQSSFAAISRNPFNQVTSKK